MCLVRILLIFHLFIISQASVDLVAKYQELEERLMKLEKIVEDIEPTFVRRYALIKKCHVPIIEHGLAQCDQETNIKPKTRCRLVCNAGYIATPGKDVTHCQEDGEWTVQMKCEVPLVVIGGGQVSEDLGDSSLEIIDFENRSKCTHKIPDMPTVNSTARTFHNLIYNPGPKEIFTCNGLTNFGPATCHKWNITGNNETWKFQGKPHKGTYLENLSERLDGNNRASMNPHKKHGRYAAEALTLHERPVIIGGLVNIGKKHEVTGTVRTFNSRDWARERLNCQEGVPRAFFCSVKIQEAGFISIGGYGSNQSVLSTVNIRPCVRREFLSPIAVRDIADIPIPITGHGCTLLPDSYDILVSGGSRSENDASLLSSYLYSWDNNSWEKTANMNTARFGHKLVTVGQNVFAIGGKHRNEHTYLDTIEKFDFEERKWIGTDQHLTKSRAHFGLVLVPRSIFPGCD